MSQYKIRLVAAALSLLAATAAYADTHTILNKSNNFSEAAGSGTPPVGISPYFNLDVAGATLNQASDVNATDQTQGHTVFYKPNVPGVQAGQVSSITIAGNYSIKGFATAANNFLDLNAIPTGITISFKTSTTLSVDPGNFLTLSTTAANGLGITQTQGTASTIDAGEVLHVSATTVSNIAFSGSIPGYTFSNPTITGFGVNVFRSGGGSDFNESTENAGLYSVPPDVSGSPTVGFGGGALGTGVAQSNTFIDNGFAADNTAFPRFQDAFDLKMLAGSFALRGINFQYDIGYDVAPIPVIVGDYNRNGVVDAADYVLWRNGDIAADGNGDTVVDQLDYDIWRGNFGATAGAGAGSALGNAAVPEPATLGLLVMGLLTICSRRNSASRA